MSLFLGFFKHENRKGLWEPPRLIDCLRVWGSVYIKKGRQRGRSRAEIAYCTQSALRYCGRESQILEPRKRSEAYNDTCRDLALFPQMWEAQFSPLQNSHELVLLGCTFLLQETEEKRPRQTMQRKRRRRKSLGGTTQRWQRKKQAKRRRLCPLWRSGRRRQTQSCTSFSSLSLSAPTLGEEEERDNVKWKGLLLLLLLLCAFLSLGAMGEEEKERALLAHFVGKR